MAKRKLPDTSLEAWRSVTKDQLDAHHSKILAALAKLGEASPEQISAYTNLDYWQVSRRMSELKKKDVVYKPGHKVLTKRGRDAYVWRLKTPGEETPTVVEKSMAGESVSDISKKLTRFIQKDLF